MTLSCVLEMPKLSALGLIALLALVYSGATLTQVTSSRAPLGASSRSSTRTASLFVSPSGSDSNPCSQLLPCATFNRAYQVASIGDTVSVESGSYPAQTINATSKKGGACDGYTIGAALTGCVTFQPDSGAAVTFSGDVTVAADYVQLKDFNLGLNAVGINECSDAVVTNVVLSGITASNLVILNASYVGVLGGTWGPLHGNQIVWVSTCGAPAADETTHLRFDGGVYHDAIQDANGQHLECIHIEPADYVTIRNSKFRNCAQHDVELGGSDTDQPETHYLIENNVMAAPCSQQGAVCQPNNPLDIGCLGPHGDWTIRFNSMDGGTQFLNDGCTWTGTNLHYGNIEQAWVMNAYQCDQWKANNFTRSYDVSNPAGTACGKGSVTGNPLTSPGPPDYNFNLIPRSIAIGLVPPSMPRPPTDIDGENRPLRYNSDAGADQWDSVLMMLGRSIGAIRIGDDIRKVVAFYGPPRTRSTLRSRDRSLERLTFRIHGGSLWLIADRGVAVGVGTTSAYYTTVTGLGVKGDASRVRSWARTEWVDCAQAFRRRYGNVVVYIGLAGGRKARQIASLAMIRDIYGYGRCKPLA